MEVLGLGEYLTLYFFPLIGIALSVIWWAVSKDKKD
jgi:hypothetical protein